MSLVQSCIPTGAKSNGAKHAEFVFFKSPGGVADGAHEFWLDILLADT
jgi:hypothetical protein